MKTFKRALAVLLTLVLVSSSFVCFAADGEKQYHKYDKYLLLGDSEASGFRDFEYRMTEFTFAPDSYSDFIAQELGAELIPMACPGFRTVELRHVLEDDYVVQDDYLYSAVPHHQPHEIEAKIPEIRQAIIDADLITLGIGGNDWGAFLGWVMTDFLEDHPLPEDYENALREFLKNATVEDNIIKTIVEFAQMFNAMDALLETLPRAVVYAFKTLNENWGHIIEDIYAMNPDVTLVVVGMFVTTYKTTPEAPDVVIEPDPMAVEVEQMIIDYGNKPMVDNEEKYGYIYVDTKGTVVEESHPTVAGHRHIANRILEELPDASFPYTDISINSSEYKAVEYMYLNNLMKGETETTFGGEKEITEAELSQVLNKISGSYEITDSTKSVNRLQLNMAVNKVSGETGIIAMFKQLISIIELIFSGNAFKNVTRAEAALRIYQAVRYK
ncbi:MAG: S-layer homology domain-containing protein [Clostridia bacterium]|nr:S-layer homology domain-containing protein [Clostridia bacterium]